VLEHILFLA